MRGLIYALLLLVCSISLADSNSASQTITITIMPSVAAWQEANPAMSASSTSAGLTLEPGQSKVLEVPINTFRFGGGEESPSITVSLRENLPSHLRMNLIRGDVEYPIATNGGRTCFEGIVGGRGRAKMLLVLLADRESPFEARNCELLLTIVER